MLGCKGVLRTPGLPSFGGFSQPLAPSHVTDRSRLLHCRSNLSRCAGRRTVLTKCKNVRFQTDKEVKRTLRRSKTVAAEEAVPANNTPSVFDEQSQGGAADRRGGFLKPVSITVPVGNREIVIETGLMGRLANGAVTITDGETVLYTTVCSSLDPTDPSDFIPLTVNYQERFSAAGRTSGGFIKREGRTQDHEILVCRLIDRPIRPLIAKSFNFETQILSWVLSFDGIHSPEPLAITAAGAALALSDIPIAKPVAGVRVGLVDGHFIVNPTVQEMTYSVLDMVIAGTSEAVLMIEGYCDLLPEERLLEAVEIGQTAVSVICKELAKFAAVVGKPMKLEGRRLPSPNLVTCIEELVGDDLEKALQLKTKKARGKAIGLVEEKLLRLLTTEGQPTVKVEDPLEELIWNEDEDGVLILEDGEVDEGDIHVRHGSQNPITELFDPTDVKLALKQVSSNIMRRFIVQSGRRSDGRGVTNVRPIEAICGLLPRVHGSALFTRGETQALAVATLGGGDMAQRVDNLTSTVSTKRFYLQYAFPQSSVGETGRVGAPSRREIGHGTLAERALERVLPAVQDFPYTVRVETTITESDGSSSMASICGGCLAMLDAGVPLKGLVAGVAMGLILDTKGLGGDGEPLILTDILGSEDALGDMDFKIAGDETGVTAFQMDIKVEGITLPVMKQALIRAREGRVHILGEMKKSNPPPAGSLSKYAPVIDLMKVRPEKVNVVIGSGGKTIKGLIEDTGVISIDVTDSGLVTIVGRTNDCVKMAKAKIAGLTMVPVVGTIYRNCRVKGILAFGCIVEIAPGKEGLVHISELDSSRVSKVEDVVKVGDLIDVKLTEINVKGQLRLSRKQVLVPDMPPDAELLSRV
ncbi:unnamed protein product [Calypogeia fissa]